MFGEGNPDADIMFIGSGPGDEEDKTGRPYVGESGAILNEFLKGSQLSRENDVYITNLVCCYPQIIKEDERTGKKFVASRDPNKIERMACRERLLETIYIVDPMLIVAFGKPAMQTLTGKNTVTARLHGEIQTMHLQGRSTELRYAVFPTYEPGHLSTNSDMSGITGLWKPAIQDFEAICKVLDFLREKYYGISPPDAGAEEPPKKKKRRVKDAEEDEFEDPDRGD